MLVHVKEALTGQIPGGPSGSRRAAGSDRAAPDRHPEGSRRPRLGPRAEALGHLPERFLTPPWNELSTGMWIARRAIVPGAARGGDRDERPRVSRGDDRRSHAAIVSGARIAAERLCATIAIRSTSASKSSPDTSAARTNEPPAPSDAIELISRT